MSAYVKISGPVKSMTEDEQKKILQVTGQRRDGFRDHTIISCALGTALREHEIVALNVGDVYDGEHVRRRFPLRVFKRSNQDVKMQETILPDTLRYKLEKFYRWKRANKEALDADSPLFVSRKGGRLSTRRLREMFANWQIEAGFERRFSFHHLRHTALSNLYRATRDIRLVQKVARHKSVESTTIYAQPSDEDVLRAVRAQPC